MSRRVLVRAAWICHAALLAAVTFGVLTSAWSTGVRLTLAAVAAAPLLAAMPGLRRRHRYTYQWLAFALVAYAGAAAVEVIAAAGRAPFATLALLAALVELGLLFTLNRVPPSPQAKHE